MPVTGPSSPLTVTGLTNGQQYRVKVRARNSAGWGPYSALSDIVTPQSGASVQQSAFRVRGSDTTALNAAFTGGSTPSASGTLRQIHLGPNWDFLMSSAHEAAVESKIHALTGYAGTSGWNVMKDWSPTEAYSYVNVFGDPDNTWGGLQLDADGAQLWLPWGTAGVDARQARDLRSTTYRNSWVAAARAILANGGEGIFVDDVNLDHVKMLRRSLGGSSYGPAQTDFGSSAYYTAGGLNGWAALLADFLLDVRARIRTGSDGGTAYPNAKFMHNTQWIFLEPLRWTDARAVRMIDSSDSILVAEHGYADPGHQGGSPGSDTGTADYKLRSLLKYTDAIHARGKNVITFARRDGVRADRERYEMALYLLKREAGDMIGLWGTYDVWPNYNPIFDIDLGARLSYSDNGTTISGTFEGGTVSVAPIDYASATITQT